MPLSLARSPLFWVKKLDVIDSFSAVVYLDNTLDFLNDHGSKLAFSSFCLINSCYIK